MRTTFNPSSSLSSSFIEHLLTGKPTFRLDSSEQEKFTQLNRLTKEVARSVGLGDEVKFSPAAVTGAPGIRALKDKQIEVQFHPALLVEKKDLPGFLKLNGPGDPKFTSSYVSEFRTWFMFKFGIPEDQEKQEGNTRIITKYENKTHSFAIFYAGLQENPEQYWPVIRFMLTRELLYIKKQKEAPILDFWSKVTSSFLKGPKEVDRVRDPFDLISVSFSHAVVFGGICLIGLMLADVLVHFGPAVLSAFVPFLGVVFIIQTLFDLSVIYQLVQREKSICQEALALTKDPRAARLFYKALNQSKWADNFCLIRWVFRPIESYFCQAAENPVTTPL